MDNKFFSKDKISAFFKEKNNRIKLITIIGLVGIALIMLSESIPKDSTEKVSSGKESSSVSVDEYKRDIQKELEKIITQIDGAGKCSVMVTFDNATENVFAYNSTREKDDKGEKQSNEYVIVKNNGDETPIVVKEIQPSIRGVIVVCEGGDNVKVKQDITESISCVFSIPSSRISVNKMSVNKER